MKAYDILEFKNDYKYVVLATSYENPIDVLDEIEYELSLKKYSGKVLFALLLCNGMNDNKYIEMEFNGENFVLSSSKILNQISNIIENFIYRYLKDRPSLVKNSVLPKAQQYLLQIGL